MYTKPTEEEIIHSMNSFFRSELLTCILFACLIFIVITVSILVYKTSILSSHFKATLLLIFVCLCSVGVVVLRAFEFFPIYTDNRNMSYVIEENAEIFILEGTDNIWNQKNEVKVKTSKGTTLKLKIANDYKFETGINLKGVIVYATHSKHIIWYKFYPMT